MIQKFYQATSYTGKCSNNEYFYTHSGNARFLMYKSDIMTPLGKPVVPDVGSMNETWSSAFLMSGLKSAHSDCFRSWK